MSLLLAAAALCLPPPPGAPEPKPPSEAEKARVIAATNRNIVSGTVLRETRDGMLRFKVQRVYKGDIKPGTVIAAHASHGFYSSQPCPGMIPPPPVMPGAKGTIAFNEIPAALNFLQANWFDEMVAAGLIAKR